MKLALVAAALVLLVVFSILGAGKLRFWKLAARFPNEAYEWFLREDCWEVDPTEPLEPRSEWCGPFKLAVPQLGWRVVRIYGRVGEMEGSQEEFTRAVAA